MIKIAVVILNWNGKHFLEKFLPSLIKYTDTSKTEIVVADSASTDESMNFIHQNYPGIRTLQLDKNYGFAGGYNKALAQIEAEYYVLLNSDIEVTSGWLDPLEEFMDADQSVAACMPKIKDYNHPLRFEYAGAAGGFMDFLGYSFCRGRIYDTVEEDKGQYDYRSEVFWATGACLFIRARLFNQAGGLDERFFAHMEEIDLCWRLKKMGFKIMYIPQSTVYHVGGGTLPQTNPFKTYLNFRNNLFLLYKNLPTIRLAITLVARMVLDGLSVIKFLLSRHYRDALAVLKAHLSFYAALSYLRKARRHTNSISVCSGNGQTYKNSIVFNYFILKRRTFNKIGFIRK